MGQKEVYDLLKENGWMSGAEIATYFSTNYPTIQVYLRKMVSNGSIMRERRYIGERRHPTYFYHIKE